MMGRVVTAGCMDVTAVNYNEDACLSDGSCQDAILGCTDPESVDFDPAANTEVATGGRSIFRTRIRWFSLQ